MQGCDWDISSISSFKLAQLEMTSSSLQADGSTSLRADGLARTRRGGVLEGAYVNVSNIRMQQGSHFTTKGVLQMVSTQITLQNSEM